MKLFKRNTKNKKLIAINTPRSNSSNIELEKRHIYEIEMKRALIKQNKPYLNID